ncbi:MAG: hypothetical protein K2X58_01180 [Pseudomonadaceae bacterium]|uniref:hypothetical protein n=1 Tax=Pseudomonas sp. TaxID=306 RepID=UPI002CBBCFAE|nr:hypothetical protein [Pseudomonas sp.]MBX9712342.1 hypothetical protein [Pseudomonadaceae bacterium]HRL91935.1 hypothetical protein [Pseudomonas sp.]
MSKRHLLSLAVCLASLPALAVEQGEYQLNGFGTVGITHMGGESDLDYGIQGQTNDGWRGDQLSKLAVQLRYGITDTLSVTGQLGTKPTQDSWEAGPGNLYLAWQANDNLTLRGGRLGTPIYMYSETLNVGFSYPWLRLPEEVYSLVQLTSHDGGDVLYNRSTDIGTLSFQVAGGQAIGREQYALDDMHDIDYRDVFATSLALSTDNFGTFRVGYAEADLKITVDDTVAFGPASVNFPFVTYEGNKGKFSSIGHQYDNGTWVSAAEAVKLSIENNSKTGESQAETNAFYIMGGRRFGDYLAHVTYGQLDEPSGRQVSMTYGLNYSFSPTVTLKGEYKRVDTSQGDEALGVFQADAQQTLNNAFGQSYGTPDADIFSVGVDFIF